MVWDFGIDEVQPPYAPYQNTSTRTYEPVRGYAFLSTRPSPPEPISRRVLIVGAAVLLAVALLAYE